MSVRIAERRHFEGTYGVVNHVGDGNRVEVVAEEGVEDGLLAGRGIHCGVLVCNKRGIGLAGRAWRCSPVPVRQSPVGGRGLVPRLVGAGESGSNCLNVGVKLLLVESEVGSVPRQKEVRSVGAVTTTVAASTTSRGCSIPGNVGSAVNASNLIVGETVALGHVLEVLQTEKVKVELIRMLLLQDAQFQACLNAIIRDTGDGDRSCALLEVFCFRERSGVCLIDGGSTQ